MLHLNIGTLGSAWETENQVTPLDPRDAPVVDPFVIGSASVQLRKMTEQWSKWGEPHVQKPVKCIDLHRYIICTGSAGVGTCDIDCSTLSAIHFDRVMPSRFAAPCHVIF